MNAKKILSIVCVVALVVVSVVGTLAYLTAQDTVENTFTVGKVNMTLDEAKVDEYGQKDGDNRVEGNNYKLIPGQSYIKDPIATIKAGSEEAYVRMLVTITDAADVLDVFGEDFLPENFVTGWNSDVWVSTKEIVNKDNCLIYEFRYHTTVDASDATTDMVLEPLFTGFTVSELLNGDDLAKLEGMKIQVTGHAIQAANFEDADAAWAGFTRQMEHDA